MFDDLAPGLGKFISDNSDIELAQDHILIRLLEREGRLHVMIEVDEDATQDKLRKIIPLACEWRDRVRNHQGAWRGGGRNELLERFSSMEEQEQLNKVPVNKRKHSYRLLANKINTKIADYLREYLAYRQEIDMLHPELKSKP